MNYLSMALLALSWGIMSAHAAPQDKNSSYTANNPTTLSGSSGEWQYRYAFSANAYKTSPVMMVMEQSLMGEDQQKKPFPLGAVLLARMTPNVEKMPLQKRPWRLTIMAPLNLSLLQPARLVFDQGQPLTLPWQMCTEKGCLATLDVTDAQLNHIRHAKNGRIMVNKVVGGVLTISFSVDGADGALSNLEGWMTHPPAR